ncbi:trypsin-like serine protease [Thozetella sp. PMI_491]|nr:trypsin-like serine protease [Thozetella sp. PMI_491]
MRSSLAALIYILLYFCSSCQGIIHGSNTSLSHFPFIVSLASSSIFGDSHICGGVIIGEKTVLTAAHCCDGSSTSSLKIRYGSNSHVKGGKYATITKITKHPNWNTNTIDYNYCILTVNPFDLSIGPSQIAKLSNIPSSSFDNKILHFAGWGKTNSSSTKLPVVLQSATERLVPHAECDNAWSDKNVITPQMICGAPSSDQDQHISACNGDSGGPLVDSESQSLVGISSYGENGCTAVPRPNVYSDIHAVSDWIRLNIS